MKKWMILVLALALSCLFAAAAFADELPEGVEIQTLDGAAPVEEIPEEPDTPEEQPLPTPAMEAAPVNSAPQTGDNGGTLLALIGMGFSLATLSLVRRIKETEL